MNKKIRELQSEILEMTKSAEVFMSEGETRNLDKAAEIYDQIDAKQKELDLEVRREKAAKAGVPTEAAPVEPKKVDSVKAFADAFRAGFKANMNETTGADGGYTVPADINVKINERKQEHFSLASLISVENVSTPSGRRTYKTRSQHTGFQQVGEGGKIGQVAAPKFEVLEYAIKKFAGYMPYTNELRDDSDASIHDLLVAWLAEEEVATENAQVLAKVNEKEATALTGIDDIKKAVNVTLAAFAGSIRIVTNSDGLQYLDTLKDANKRYLLAPDPTDHMNMYLSVGARRIPVTVVPNDVMPTAESGAIPFIIGDLKEYMKKFDRKQMTLSVSEVAVAGEFNAFEMDMTLIRAIMRADWVILDEAAIVRGELTPA